MPQATDEHRERWNGPDEREAVAYLQARGYRLTREWCWLKPKSIAVPTDMDNDAVKFMIDEWDYGFIICEPEELGG